MPPDYTLYLATDPDLIGNRSLVEVVESAIANGVTMVQLRDKTASGAALFDTGRRLLAITRRHAVPLIINDRLDVMLALDADGVHVGEHDLPLERVRCLAPGKIVGYSVQTLAHLRRAEAAGVDYVGVGPVFATPTKSDAAPALGIEGLRQITAAARVPCVAIGGITAENAAPVAGTGVAGICVISAILGAADTAQAVRRLRAAFASSR